MSFRIVFYDDVGALSHPLYELKRLECNCYVVQAIPLSIRGNLSTYEEQEQCKFFYFYDSLNQKEKKFYQSFSVELISHSNKGYSIVVKDEGKKPKKKTFL